MDDYDLSNFSSSKKSQPRRAGSGRYGRQPQRRTDSRNTNNSNRSTPTPNGNRQKPSTVNSRQRKTNKRKNSKSKFVVVLVVILVLAVAVTVGVVKFNIDNSNRPFTFSKDVTVSGIDISGLTYEQALERLKENSDSLIKEYDIVIKSNGR